MPHQLLLLRYTILTATVKRQFPGAFSTLWTPARPDQKQQVTTKVFQGHLCQCRAGKSATQTSGYQLLPPDTFLPCFHPGLDQDSVLLWIWETQGTIFCAVFPLYHFEARVHALARTRNHIHHIFSCLYHLLINKWLNLVLSCFLSLVLNYFSHCFSYCFCLCKTVFVLRSSLVPFVQCTSPTPQPGLLH